MPKSYDDLVDKMSLVSGLVPLVQIDVMDGVFVLNKSWPYVQKPDPDFTAILNEEEGFPFWEEIDFEVDLMVSDPISVAQEWITVGAKRLILHFESFASVDEMLAGIKKIREMLPAKDSILYAEIGVAINPNTSNDVLESILSEVDFVQFMGIEKIGFQGQIFDPRVLDKISRLRASHPKVTISVDGAVSLETAPKLITAGVNRLAVGSAIFAAEDAQTEIEKFFEIAAGDLASGTNENSEVRE
jgi:ribulose-phosphate 3-epimerase